MSHRALRLPAILFLGAILCASATIGQPAAANQPPFGNIDQPGPDGVWSANGSFAVVGWALDDSGIVDHIDFTVDGQIVAGAVGNGQTSTALYGIPRPDVFAAFPDIPNSLNSGFWANIDTTRLVNGSHVLAVRAFDGQGISTVLGTRPIQVINNGVNLPPFGAVDYPLENATLRCQAPRDILQPQVYDSLVSGWALDVGAILDQGQVGYVELLLDGAILANTRRDCVRNGSLLANCYGVPRPDVARAYPGLVNAETSGFQFVFALEPDPSNGLVRILMPGTLGEARLVGWTFPGSHKLTIRAGDVLETVTQFASLSVNVLCDSGPFFDRAAIGYIDTPSRLQGIKGVFGFSGWAFDPDNGGRGPGVNGILRLDIAVDGQVVGSLFPPYISRPDVPASDLRVPPAPGVTPPTAFVGWILPFDTTHLSDGQHDLVVYSMDTPDARTGRPSFRSEIGRRRFIVVNNTATKR